ncbi:unnamed protein product, partial [Thlaspi arvense]
HFYCDVESRKSKTTPTRFVALRNVFWSSDKIPIFISQRFSAEISDPSFRKYSICICDVDPCRRLRRRRQQLRPRIDHSRHGLSPSRKKYNKMFDWSLKAKMM